VKRANGWYSTPSRSDCTMLLIPKGPSASGNYPTHSEGFVLNLPSPLGSRPTSWYMLPLTVCAWASISWEEEGQSGCCCVGGSARRSSRGRLRRCHDLDPFLCDHRRHTSNLLQALLFYESLREVAKLKLPCGKIVNMFLLARSNAH
jgi:hypothetical protein